MYSPAKKQSAKEKVDSAKDSIKGSFTGQYAKLVLEHFDKLLELVDGDPLQYVKR